MKQLIWWATVFALAALAWAEVESEIERKEKLVSAFQVVQFPNDHCVGSSSRNGTCYTSEECENKNGKSLGSCAEGFGVCCVFEVTCGGVSSENITYFETQSVTGQCRTKICPIDSDVCKLRLDLDEFVITGPTTVTTSAAKQIGGEYTSNNAAGQLVTLNGQCATDTFTVTSGQGVRVPTICGTMTGQHLYVDVLDSCNELAFQLSPTARDPATLATRRWRIKVTQIPCDDPNIPPEGCQQYYFGSTSGQIQSYNFDGSHHLAHQYQTTCIRRERGTCQICYVATAATDFVVSGKGNSAKGYVVGQSCCGYGSDGVQTEGYDCLVIPGASNVAGNIRPSQICGRSAGLVTANSVSAGNAAGNVSVCSKMSPFRVSFYTDGFEMFNAIAANTEPAAGVANKGWRLDYRLISTGC